MSNYAVRVVWPLPRWIWRIMRWYGKRFDRTMRIYYAVIVPHEGPWDVIAKDWSP